MMQIYEHQTGTNAYGSIHTSDLEKLAAVAQQGPQGAGGRARTGQGGELTQASRKS